MTRNPFTRALSAIVSVSFAILVLPVSARAAAPTTYWINTSVGNWDIASNWSDGIPGGFNFNFNEAQFDNGAFAFKNAPGSFGENILKALRLNNGTVQLSGGAVLLVNGTCSFGCTGGNVSIGNGAGRTGSLTVTGSPPRGAVQFNPPRAKS